MIRVMVIRDIQPESAVFPGLLLEFYIDLAVNDAYLASHPAGGAFDGFPIF